jgi:hypothetical protein
LEIKDDQVLYLKQNIFLGNYFYCILGKKTNSKCPMTRYYSLYFCHNFVFFALESMGIISCPNIFFTNTNLIIFYFQEDSKKIDLFKLL